MTHYYKQVNDAFQLYISYNGEHFHFVAQRPTLTEVTLLWNSIRRGA